MCASERGGAEADAHWQEVCREMKLEDTSITKEAFVTILLQKRVSTRSLVEHHYPDVQFILTALAGSLVDLTEEGDLFLEDVNLESLNMSMVIPTDSILAKMHHAKAYVFSDSVLCLGGSPMSK